MDFSFDQFFKVTKLPLYIWYIKSLHARAKIFFEIYCIYETRGPHIYATAKRSGKIFLRFIIYMKHKVPTFTRARKIFFTLYTLYLYSRIKSNLKPWIKVFLNFDPTLKVSALKVTLL